MSIQTQKHFHTEARAFCKLAVPLASAQVAQSATGFADTIMMGRMGADVLAAGGLAAVVFLLLMVTISGMVMGVSPLIAEAVGAKQKRRIEQVARQGLWLSLLIAIPFMIVTGHLGVWIAQTGQTETTITLADTYLDIILWSLFPVAGFAALRSTVSALSQGKPIMIIIGVGTAFNILGNYVLGFGKWGFPEMGLAGLALATTVTWWGMFIALALYVARHPSLRDYRIFQSLHRITPRVLGQLAWVGVPIGLFSGLEMGFYTMITFWVGTLGTEMLAAHQIVFQTATVMFMVPLGSSFATTVRVGQWVGQRDLRGLQRAAWVSMAMTTLFMMGASTLFLVFPRQIVGLYLNLQDPVNENIVALATPLLMVGAIAQVLDGFQKAVYGSLQGLQDTQVPMVLNIVGYWGIGLLVGYGLGFGLQMGGIGLWIGQAVAAAAVAGLFSWRLHHLIKQRKQLT
ncbi:MAG: MATE family efflux transporter [Leptolyngbya sp. SIO1E4]|nr:MATE family efflux transporter [Leptolyngbya sp. SIO1E4]